MFTNCIPVMCAKNISVIAVKKQWCLKLLAKLFTWKSKDMRRLFSFNYNLCNPFLSSKIILVKTNESCT